MRLMDVFGIRIGVDGSWFLILFLMIFWLSPSFRDALHSSEFADQPPHEVYAALLSRGIYLASIRTRYRS